MDLPYIRRKKRKEEHLATDYVNNKTFQSDLYAWYELCKETPDLRIPARIWICVEQICKRLASKANFSGYSYIDEMKDAAVEKCIKALMEKKYNPYKFENPFAYFTTVAFYEFLRVLKEEQRESYIKHASLLNLHQEMAMDPNVQHDDSEMMNKTDINWALIEKFQPASKRGGRKGKTTPKPHTAEEVEHLEEEMIEVVENVDSDEEFA